MYRYSKRPDIHIPNMNSYYFYMMDFHSLLLLILDNIENFRVGRVLDDHLIRVRKSGLLVISDK